MRILSIQRHTHTHTHTHTLDVEGANTEISQEDFWLAQVAVEELIKMALVHLASVAELL
jgi:hypothetical protein